MKRVLCSDCQKKINLADVSGVDLYGWRWFTLRNYFYQTGILVHILIPIIFILKYLNA